MKLLILEDHGAIRETVIRYVQEIKPNIEIIETDNVEDADQAMANAIISYAIYRDRIPFMIYSSHVNKSLIKELETKRVRCYVSKQSDMKEFKTGLKALFNNRKHYCPIVMETLKSKTDEEDTGRLKLSKSERKVVELLSKGQTREEVADNLHLEITTINNHVFRAREANGCPNVSDLLRRYRFWTPE
jgi:DNA-binding NarL/FixJ family response regulator